jgi:hypothetical protein
VDSSLLGCAAARGAGGAVELVSYEEGSVAVGRGEEKGEGEIVSWEVR